MNVQRQELHCTNCGGYIQFNMDFELDGNHEITCPECQHVHHRVVRDGKITEERWRPSAPTYAVTSATYTTTGYVSSATTTSTYFLRDLWLNGTYTA